MGIIAIGIIPIPIAGWLRATLCPGFLRLLQKPVITRNNISKTHPNIPARNRPFYPLFPYPPVRLLHPGPLTYNGYHNAHGRDAFVRFQDFLIRRRAAVSSIQDFGAQDLCPLWLTLFIWFYLRKRFAANLSNWDIDLRVDPAYSRDPCVLFLWSRHIFWHITYSGPHLGAVDPFKIVSQWKSIPFCNQCSKTFHLTVCNAGTVLTFGPNFWKGALSKV